jgi:CHRD domain
MRKRSKPLGARLPRGVALAVVVICLLAAALAAGASGQPVPLFSRLGADLTASQEIPAAAAPTTAKGRFDAVLIRGLTVTPRTMRGAIAVGCHVVVQQGKPTTPAKLTCGANSVPVQNAPVRTRQWRLLWRLSYSGLSGPATAAHIHFGAQGTTAPGALALCGPCRSVSGGILRVTADQAGTIRAGGSYVNVETAANPSGEIRGQVAGTTIGVATTAKP